MIPAEEPIANTAKRQYPTRKLGWKPSERSCRNGDIGIHSPQGGKSGGCARIPRRSCPLPPCLLAPVGLRAGPSRSTKGRAGFFDREGELGPTIRCQRNRSPSHPRRERAALNPRRLANVSGGEAVVIGAGGVSLFNVATGDVEQLFDSGTATPPSSRK